MQLPDEAIEAAAIEYETQIFGSREDVSELTHRAFKADAKRILEAAAPLIAEQALRSAADYLDTNTGPNAIGIRRAAEAIRLIAQLEARGV